jgi:hypothetical protein
MGVMPERLYTGTFSSRTRSCAGVVALTVKLGIGRASGINGPTLVQSGVIHQIEVLTVLLQVAVSRYDHINSDTQAD